MNNNETILKFKDVKNEIKSVVKDAVIKDKEEIIKIIDFDDNKKSKSVNKVTFNVVDPVVEEIKDTTITEGEVVGNSNGAVEIPNNIEQEKDYEVKDLCDIKQQEPEFTKAPRDEIDISDILARVDSRLNESQGESYGIINVLFTRSARDRICESSLLEFRTRGKVYTLCLTITEGKNPGFYKFRVNNTLGKKIFERETKNPAMLIESYFKAINFKVLAESVLMNKHELLEAAAPLLTTLKRFLKKENIEGLVDIVPQGDSYIVSITGNEGFLNSKGTEYSWQKFVELHNLLKSGFPSAGISDINEGTFTFREL